MLLLLVMGSMATLKGLSSHRPNKIWEPIVFIVQRRLTKAVGISPCAAMISWVTYRREFEGDTNPVEYQPIGGAIAIT